MCDKKIIIYRFYIAIIYVDLTDYNLIILLMLEIITHKR